MRRRDLLAGAAAAAGAAFVGAAAPRTAPFRIDIHRHLSPKDLTTNPSLINLTTLTQTIADMDEGGVAYAVLSGQSINDRPMADRARLARAMNDNIAQAMAQTPGRFGLFAAAPLPDLDASLSEIAYCYDTLKADGVNLWTHYGERWLGDPYFDPLYQELNRRKAIVYVHPNNPECCTPKITGLSPAVIEFGADTTRTISSMIINRTSRRFPNIRFIFSHGGGVTPYLAQRYRTWAEDPAGAALFPDGVAAEFARFYYDVAQTYDRAPLLALKNFVPATQIVYGTDFPYRTGAQTNSGLELSRVFSAADLRLIYADNAAKLLGKPALIKRRG